MDSSTIYVLSGLLEHSRFSIADSGRMTLSISFRSPRARQLLQDRWGGCLYRNRWQLSHQGNLLNCVRAIRAADFPWELREHRAAELEAAENYLVTRRTAKRERGGDAKVAEAAKAFLKARGVGGESC